MEDVVIKLHDLAREVTHKEIAESIRHLADNISDKIKVERQHGQHR